jgi:nucleoside 2-deoxyribosyltransferase
MDHRDIRQSDVVLVNALRPSWGTAMEVYFAASLGKTIFAVCGDREPSIWLRHYTTTLFRSFGGAIQAIQDLGKKHG